MTVFVPSRSPQRLRSRPYLSQTLQDGFREAGLRRIRELEGAVIATPEPSLDLLLGTRLLGLAPLRRKLFDGFDPHGIEGSDMRKPLKSTSTIGHQSDFQNGCEYNSLGSYSMTSDNRTLTMGFHGSYQWFATGQYELGDFLRSCPMVLLGKYVAVTSLDSGPLLLSEEEKIAGWQSRNGIAYSPQVQLPDQLPHAGFDEWYVFDSPKDLGQLWRGNVFETPRAAGHIADFVNFGGFAPHNSEVEDLLSLFWEQVERIQPESYVADGTFLTFVSRDKQIFAAVCRAMTDVPATS